MINDNSDYRTTSEKCKIPNVLSYTTTADSISRLWFGLQEAEVFPDQQHSEGKQLSPRQTSEAPKQDAAQLRVGCLRVSQRADPLTSQGGGNI